MNTAKEIEIENIVRSHRVRIAEAILRNRGDGAGRLNSFKKDAERETTHCVEKIKLAAGDNVSSFGESIASMEKLAAETVNLIDQRSDVDFVGTL